MKKLLLIILIFSTQLVFGSKKEKKILNLVKLEIRSIVKMKRRDHNISYRLFELYSERLQLLRRIENQKLFKGITKKDKAYTESNRLFDQTQAFGQHYLTKYKKSRHIADVYIRLASNIIHVKNDLASHEATIKGYLKEALKRSDDSQLQHQAKVTLGELDYNLERFKDAAKHYKVVIRDTQDPGYTRHLLNYSWCLFKLNNYTKAISLAKKSFFTAKKNPKKYDDTRERVGNALNYFYTYNKQPGTAISFHGTHFPSEIATNSVRVVNLSLSRISSAVALKAERKARSYCVKLSDTECLYRLSQLKLDILKTNKNYTAHYKTSQALESEFKKLTKKEKEYLETETLDIINNIGDTTTFLQELAYKGKYSINGDKKQTYKVLIKNYDVLTTLKPEMKFEYAYLQGEISYKEKFYNKAAGFYQKSYKGINKKTKKDFKDKVLNSMLALANEKDLKNDKFFEYASKQYIKNYPRSEKSIKIYEALFNFFFSKKRIKAAEGLVKKYNTRIPSKLKSQQEMQKTITNHYIKKKDTKKFISLISSYEKGYLSFSQEFIAKNKTILGSLAFETAKKLESKGEIAKAMIEYEKIFNNKYFPSDIRYDAAFNLGINKLKKQETDSAFNWIKSVVEKDSKKNIQSKLDSILTAAQELYLLQKLNFSKTLYGFISQNYCLDAKTYPAHFPQIQELNLATNDYQSFQVNQARAKKCKISKEHQKNATLSYIENIVLNNRADQLITKMKNDPSYMNYQEMIVDNLIKNYWSVARPNNLETTLSQFDQVNNFTKGNKYTNMKVITKTSEVITFHRYAKSSINQKYYLPAQTEFELPIFEQAFTDQMGTLNRIKEEGIQLAESSSSPDVYSSILAIVYKNFKEFKKTLQDFKVNSSDPAFKTDVENNLAQIIAGIQEQENGFVSSFHELKNKNTLKNHFIRLFKRTQTNGIATSISEGELDE